MLPEFRRHDLLFSIMDHALDLPDLPMLFLPHLQLLIKSLLSRLNIVIMN